MKKYLLSIAVLCLTEIGLALYLTFWKAQFWDMVAAKLVGDFLHQLIIFTVVALILCLVSGMTGYLINLAIIKWRTILTPRLEEYKIDHNVTCCGQRIQEDCKEYPKLVLYVGVGLFKSIMYILVFGVSLALNFSYMYLLILIGYSILFTWVGKKIAHKLIKINYDMQQREASLRKKIDLEHGGRSDAYVSCIHMMRMFAVKTKHLQYFQSFYGQIGVIIPILIVAPEYFYGAMTLGLLMQATSTMSTLGDNLSFGINSFNDINKLISCRQRLKEINLL